MRKQIQHHADVWKNEGLGRMKQVSLLPILLDIASGFNNTLTVIAVALDKLLTK